MVRVAIVGTGDEAHALAHLYHNYNTASSGHSLEVTKPSIAKNEMGTFHRTGVPLTGLDDALYYSDVVILAIPVAALRTFVSDNFSLLKEKIIVDTTNSFIPGEDVNSILAVTNVRFVKAFNDLGAVDLLQDKPSSKSKIQSKICSMYPEAAQKVKAFAEDSLGLDIKIIPFERYPSIGRHQKSYGENWIKSMWVMLATFAFAELYAILRYNVFKGYDWFHLPLQVTNKAMCWTAIYGFAITQFPGIFARMSNSIYGNTLRDKLAWLRTFLGMRKHLGLLSLWFLVVHIIMSLLLFNPGYYSKFFITKDGTSKLNVIGETSFFFGILGFALYMILGICSLPSVGTQMTNAQWQLVYGPLAWIALVFGTAHVLVMGAKGWSDGASWPGGMPPITLTSTLLPLTAMTLKISQTLSWRIVAACFPPDDAEKYRKRKISMGSSPITDKASSTSAGSVRLLCGLEPSSRAPALMEEADGEIPSSSSSKESPSKKKRKKKVMDSSNNPPNTTVSMVDSFALPD